MSGSAACAAPRGRSGQTLSGRGSTACAFPAPLRTRLARSSVRDQPRPQMPLPSGPLPGPSPRPSPSPVLRGQVCTHHHSDGSVRLTPVRLTPVRHGQVSCLITTTPPIPASRAGPPLHHSARLPSGSCGRVKSHTAPCQSHSPSDWSARRLDGEAPDPLAATAD